MLLAGTFTAGSVKTFEIARGCPGIVNAHWGRNFINRGEAAGDGNKPQSNDPNDASPSAGAANIPNIGQSQAANGAQNDAQNDIQNPVQDATTNAARGDIRNTAPSGAHTNMPTVRRPLPPKYPTLPNSVSGALVSPERSSTGSDQPGEIEATGTNRVANNGVTSGAAVGNATSAGNYPGEKVSGNGAAGQSTTGTAADSKGSGQLMSAKESAVSTNPATDSNTPGTWEAALPEELFVPENSAPTSKSAKIAPPPIPGTLDEYGDLVDGEYPEYELDDIDPTPPPVTGIPVDTSAPLGLDYPLPKGRFTDRELSWMEFNERVLEQSEDETLPLLERLWFSSIFSSNLDEFYMVRVAGLQRRIKTGIAKTGASGLTPREVLSFVAKRTSELFARQSQGFTEHLRPALDAAGIHLLDWDQLTAREKNRLNWYFRNQVFPVLTPLAVDPSHPFPYISGLSLNIAVSVRNPASGKRHFARIKVPEALPRLINIDTARRGGRAEDYIRSTGGARFILLEQVIIANLDHLFPGVEILEADTFRVTRNEDLEVEEDDAENLLTAIEDELARRRFGAVVRLEVADTMSDFILQFLIDKLEISEADVFRLPGPLDFRVWSEMHGLDVPALKYAPYVPVTPAGLRDVESAEPVDVFTVLRNRDVLAHHPYDSFSTSVQHFITQAARDPQVLAIKQTLYRTSGDSPIVSALIEAAVRGKQVVAVVEIKARFDEEANISWARALERAGVHVVYGMVGLKTHCKLSMAVRQEGDKLRRYCHIGTGNYHPKTARGYEDLGLLTADPVIAQDMSRLFNQLSGYGPRSKFHKLLVAPMSIRSGLLERIEGQTQNKLAGQDAWIGIKVNSIVDEQIIDALYRASQAGVKVDIVVRGICALRPGIKGLSENIRVRSILGRFLEHSRIFAFGPAGQEEVWIGSADLMHRNLDRRIETLVKIENREHIKYLAKLIRKEVSPKTSSWHLNSNGAWWRRKTDKSGHPLRDVQVELMREASARVVGRQ